MAAIGDENLPLTSDFAYQQYAPPVIQAPVPVVEGGTTVVTNINGAVGPNITIDGGSTGYGFNTSSSTISLTVSNAATVRSSISAAESGVNTDITQLNGASQVDVSGEYKVSGTQVVGAQQPAIPDPTGGAVIDVEARATEVLILTALRAHGLIA